MYLSHDSGPRLDRRVKGIAAGLLLAASVVSAAAAAGDPPAPKAKPLPANFSTHSGPARKFGTHEIVLTGNGAVPNLFDTVAEVTFTPPSKSARAVTVKAFYDGGNTWRARVYVTEVGTWNWSSRSPSDDGLNRLSGRFTAVESDLPGIMKLNPANRKAWTTASGKPFISISDTAWLLFNRESTLWQQYVQDDAARGITVLGPVGSLESWGTGDVTHRGNNNPWVEKDSADYTRYDLAKFQNADDRIIWIFNHYPNLFIQSMLFGTQLQTNWSALPQPVREHTMDYMIARWSAFPSLFWLVSEDQDTKQTATLAFNREVGNYFACHEPWKHLKSTQPNRFQGFPFTTAADWKWVDYVHVQDANGLGAEQIQKYQLGSVPRQVQLGEDYYEQDYGKPPSRWSEPAYYVRWSMWSWILSGGAANYGGRYGVVHPYSQTGRKDLAWVGPGGSNYAGHQLHGLDATAQIVPYFEKRATSTWLSFNRMMPWSATSAAGPATSGTRNSCAGVRTNSWCTTPTRLGREILPR